MYPNYDYRDANVWMSASGQTLRIRSALKPTNVCYAPNSDNLPQIGPQQLVAAQGQTHQT